MTVGFEGTNGARTTSPEKCQEILDVLFDHGHTEIDTARIYADGTTEQAGVTAFDPRREVVCLTMMFP